MLSTLLKLNFTPDKGLFSGADPRNDWPLIALAAYERATAAFGTEAFMDFAFLWRDRKCLLNRFRIYIFE